MASSQEQNWVIEKEDSGEWLSTRDRYSDAGIGFDGRVPLHWQTLRDAKKFWLKHCCEEGYIKRKVSLAGMGVRYRKGPDYMLMPRVRFVRIDMVRGDFETPTLKELGIET